MTNSIDFYKLCLIFVIIICAVSQIYCQSKDTPDLCKTNPCANKGLCVQTNISPGYKCQCSGTGFYGSRCKQACPKPGASLTGRRQSFPFECIVI